MKVKLEKGAFAPERTYEKDGGLDLKAMRGGRIMPGSYMVFRTGTHVELPEGTAGLLVSKSGLNTKYGITSTGLIDEGFTGEIMVALHNNGSEAHMVNAGDKITQLVVIPILRPEIEIVDEISGDERGDNGFGSTGL